MKIRWTGLSSGFKPMWFAARASRRRPRRAAAVAPVLVVLSGSLLALLPTSAAASLPDNRIYEEASPSNKDGNAIVPTAIFPFEWGIGLAAGDGNAVVFQTTGAVGKETNQGGIQEDIARHVAGQGWSTEPADSRQLGQLGLVASPEVAGFYASSNDFSHVFFDPTGCCTNSEAAYSSEEPASGVDLKLYLDENPLAPPTWVGKPLIAKPIPAPGTELPNWLVAGVTPEGTMYFSYSGTLLPEDEQPLVEIDKEMVPGPQSRAAHVGNGTGGAKYGEGTNRDAWGFYEWSNGGLSEAGVRPNGTLSPWGSVAAASATSARGRTYNGEVGTDGEQQNGQVSEDGKRVFFVSPDPQSEQLEENAKKELVPVKEPEPAELYMRETLTNGEHRSVLVSRDDLLKDVNAAGKEVKPGEVEYPAQAPGGVSGIEDFAPSREYGGGGSTAVFASPDGSHVFFASEAALTSAVPSRSEFRLGMGYWEGGHFRLEVTNDGSTQTTAPIRWEAKPAEVQSALEALSNVGAGKVEVEGFAHEYAEYTIKYPTMDVAKMAINETELVGNSGNSIYSIEPPNVYEFDVATDQLTYIPELAAARFAASSTDGSRVMFLSANGDLDLLTGGTEDPKVETIVSKLDTSANPARAAADGSAFLFYASSYSGGPLSEFNNGGYSQFYHYDVATKELACVSCPPAGVYPSGPAETNYDSRPRAVEPVRMMSEDGTRVFFQSPDPLVGADVNGEPDVYEWENGQLYLISAGDSTVPSYLVDSSASGGDVFFATAQGLIPSDKDEQTDIYDARIPRPGDNPPPTQTPCSGEVCQGPPSVPQLLTPAASATFEGLGNIPEEVVAPEKQAPSVTCKKGSVKKNGKCVKKKTKRRKKAKKGKKSAAGNGRGK